MVYLDDVIIAKKAFEKHFKNLKDVFSRLKSAGLRLSSKKCQLFKKNVHYLEHIASKEGIAVDTGKINAVIQCQVISYHQNGDAKFPGLCTYDQRFVPVFATIA